VLLNGLRLGLHISAPTRRSLIAHISIVVVQLFLLLSPSSPKGVAQLAVAQMVCRSFVCRPSGLSPRWLVSGYPSRPTSTSN